MKQPSRLRKMVSRSRLRFKRRTTVSDRTGKLTQSDLEPELDFGDEQNNLVFTEDECTIGCYSPGSTDDGLPIPIPPGTLIRHESDAGDSLSNTDSISSAASTTGSAPVRNSVTLPGTWQQRSHRGRHHVGWADKENIELTQVSMFFDRILHVGLLSFPPNCARLLGLLAVYLVFCFRSQVTESSIVVYSKTFFRQSATLTSVTQRNLPI